MKKAFIALMFSLVLVFAPTQKSHAVVWWVVKEAIKKALKAADLAIQRLQNKTIGLQNAQKQIENSMSKLKLKEISEWAEKQRKMFENYYDELAKVKNTIATYKRARQIIEGQLALVEQYQRAWKLLKQDKHFSPQELEYMYRVYSGILESSLKNVEQLYLVISEYKTTMSDGKRLEMIAGIALQLEQNHSDLKKFNNQNFVISLQRSRSESEAAMIKRLYGLQ